MAGHRMERVNQLLLKEIASVIHNELADPAIGFVTVLSTETSPDLKNCTIYISRMGSAEEKKETVDALSRASRFIRRTIMPRLEMRIVPMLHFKLDETVERAARISDLLHQGTGAGGTGAEGASDVSTTSEASALADGDVQ